MAENSSTMQPRAAAYFHGQLSREDAENRVCENGDFLLRCQPPNLAAPPNSDAQFVVTTKWNGRKLHIPVRCRLNELTKECVYYFDDVQSVKPVSSAMQAVSTSVFALIDNFRDGQLPVSASGATLFRPVVNLNTGADNRNTVKVTEQVSNVENAVSKAESTVSNAENEVSNDETKCMKSKLERERPALNGVAGKRVPIRNGALWQREEQLADYSLLENVLRAPVPQRGSGSGSNQTVPNVASPNLPMPNRGSNQPTPNLGISNQTVPLPNRSSNQTVPNRIRTSSPKMHLRLPYAFRTVSFARRNLSIMY